MKDSEEEYQNGISENYQVRLSKWILWVLIFYIIKVSVPFILHFQTMSDTTFKALRRALPVTKTKVGPSAEIPLLDYFRWIGTRSPTTVLARRSRMFKDGVFLFYWRIKWQHVVKLILWRRNKFGNMTLLDYWHHLSAMAWILIICFAQTCADVVLFYYFPTKYYGIILLAVPRQLYRFPCHWLTDS